ncbi:MULTISPECIES: hypothetical protein [unclassified Frankia]|uniref:hypothetical protein n=2 Tax=Frankia TaxID=1854 RepID=UPI001EF589CF|nr:MULTISPECIES: hypothetical protein [unclassified Frankia]
MAGVWDANIKAVYPTNPNLSVTVDTVTIGAAFDVVADVEIGSRLNEVVDSYTLSVSVVNLSQANVLVSNKPLVAVPIAPQVNTPRTDLLRVHFPAGWVAADEGDVLEIVASYKVTAGVNTNVSSLQSSTFVVVA